MERSRTVEAKDYRVTYKLTVVATADARDFDSPETAELWFKTNYFGAKVSGDKVAQLVRNSDVNEFESHFEMEGVE